RSVNCLSVLIHDAPVEPRGGQAQVQLGDLGARLRLDPDLRDLAPNRGGLGFDMNDPLTRLGQIHLELSVLSRAGRDPDRPRATPEPESRGQWLLAKSQRAFDMDDAKRHMDGGRVPFELEELLPPGLSSGRRYREKVPTRCEVRPLPGS